jgi:OmpA-OmpF porin, OOP family
MKMKKIIGCLGLAALALVSGTAFAQSWYVGASYAATKGEVNTGTINGDLASLGFSSVSTSGDEDGSGGRAFVGYNVLPWLDAELYYADLGKTSWNSTVTPPGTLSASTKSSAWGLAALASFSPMDKVKLFGKLGVAQTEAKASFSSSGFVELATSGQTETNTAFVYGVGATWEFAPRFVARLEYDVHDDVGSDSTGGSFKVQSLALGLSLRF